MYHFFVEQNQIHVDEKRVVIIGSDVNHIKNVLRMKVGEEIGVSNGQDGKEYRCGILELGESSVLCELRFIKEAGAELPCEVVLYQGLPKADKMELIIQKCVELGVTRIVPVATKRAVMKLDPKKAPAKIARWQAIAEAAAKQSKRGIIPTIGNVMTFGEALQSAKDLEVRLIPYEMSEDSMGKTRDLLGNIRPGQSIGIFIGPEGGFDESEIQKAMDIDAAPITLGKRILRTETAGMVVMSWLVYLLEQDGE